jgi:hypothetical protein
MLYAIDLGLAIGLTAVVAVVAVSVAVVPIVLMLVSEHRHLHGGAGAWLRRNGRRPESVLDLPRMYNQTAEEEHQELV